MRAIGGRWIGGVLALGLLAGCQSSGVETSRAGFKANYIVARTALEQGQFDKAARGYKALLSDAGPLEPRVRLEYAHALLREGKFSKAADEARLVAAGLSGPGRSAALAVQGTAEHELAMANIAKGRTGAATIALLQSARFALQEMLSVSPELDPNGSMRARVGDIGTALQGLL